jgi:hypothetical protein
MGVLLLVLAVLFFRWFFPLFDDEFFVSKFETYIYARAVKKGLSKPLSIAVVRKSYGLFKSA